MTTTTSFQMLLLFQLVCTMAALRARQFVKVNFTFTPVNEGSATWGDYDGDGDLDVVLTGRTTNSLVTQTLRNDGLRSDTSWVFTDIRASLTRTYYSNGKWADIDRDGDLDLVVSGDFKTVIYRNDGEDQFTFVTNLVGLLVATTEWGDYNNDGYPDLLVSGATDIYISDFVVKLFRNNKDWTFTEINAPLPRAYAGQAKWGDLDNDGKLDIVVSGAINRSPGTYILKIFKNQGNDNFIEVSSNLPAGTATISFGDYDNDGKLDIFLTGRTAASEHLAELYRNTTSRKNSIPSTPSLEAAAFSGKQLALTWKASTDPEQSGNNAQGLSYNLYLKKEAGRFVRPPLADIGTGYRQIVEIGNAGQRTTAQIKLTDDGTYQWSVQAIDHSFMASAIAPEESLTVEIPPDPPQGVRADSGFQLVVLKWRKNTENDVAKYYIYFGTSSLTLTNKDSTAGVADTSKVIRGLTNGQRYFFRVTAIDIRKNESMPSSLVSTTPTKVPTLRFSQESIACPDLAVGDSSFATVYARNATPDNVRLMKLSNRHKAYSYTFSTPFLIVPGDSVKIGIRFTPLAYGSFPDALFFATENDTVPLSLNGASSFPELLPTPAMANFMYVAKDSTRRRRVFIRNNSVNALRIESSFTKSAYFFANLNTAVVLPKSTGAFMVGFKPRELASYVDTLYLQSNAGIPQVTIPLIGLRGFCPYPTIIANPSAIDFGDVRLDSTAQKILEILNASISVLRIDSIRTRRPYFTVHPKESFFVYRGSNGRIEVKFTPRAVGSFQDTVYVFNSSLQSPIRIALNGQGVLRTGIENGDSVLLKEYQMLQNYPNPFKPVTKIEFSIPYSSYVTLKVFSVSGEEVATLLAKPLNAGFHEVKWDATDFVSGIYFYRLQAEGFTETKNMILLR